MEVGTVRILAKAKLLQPIYTKERTGRVVVRSTRPTFPAIAPEEWVNTLRIGVENRISAFSHFFPILLRAVLESAGIRGK